jgi:hypothetical protein
MMWIILPAELLLFLALRRTTLPPKLMDPIVNHQAVSAFSLESKPRKKLQGRHKYLFLQNDTSTSLSLFDELAIVACETGVVPRKELLETFCAATFIHAKFPQVRRIADLAAGHGLLSWFLLALDPSRTAICVDKRIPASAEKISLAMLKRFPQLESQWSYVQADLSVVEAHSSTLLTSVHACGSLTDFLIEIAIPVGAPLAVVPCCHTVNADKGYRPHVLSGMDADAVAALVAYKHPTTTIGDIVDEIRCCTLEKAGYQMEEAMLPEVFTKRNRLLLGVLLDDSQDEDRTKSAERTTHQTEGIAREQHNSGRLLSLLRLPLADDPESIAYCRSVSGKEQAAARLLELIPRHFSPVLDISIWLPSNQPLPQATVEALADLANQCAMETMENKKLQCDVYPLGKEAVQSKTGLRSQTYRVEYKASEGTPLGNAHISRETAKAIHHSFCERIQSALGLEVR